VSARTSGRLAIRLNKDGMGVQRVPLIAHSRARDRDGAAIRVA